MDTLSLGNLSYYTSTCLAPEHLSEDSPVCLSVLLFDPQNYSWLTGTQRMRSIVR